LGLAGSSGGRASATHHLEKYGSLSKEHAESHPQEILIDPEFMLPPLSNIAIQPVGSNACGCNMLHYSGFSGRQSGLEMGSTIGRS